MIVCSIGITLSFSSFSAGNFNYWFFLFGVVMNSIELYFYFTYYSKFYLYYNYITYYFVFWSFFFVLSYSILCSFSTFIYFFWSKTNSLTDKNIILILGMIILRFLTQGLATRQERH